MENKPEQTTNNINNKIIIDVSWRLGFYMFYIGTLSFFLLKALARSYDTWLAGLLFMMYFFSHGFSMFLIQRKEE